ncbi:MAG: hypothetical protein AB1426_06675 [Bacillota bacterium]
MINRYSISFFAAHADFSTHILVNEHPLELISYVKDEVRETRFTFDGYLTVTYNFAGLRLLLEAAAAELRNDGSV